MNFSNFKNTHFKQILNAIPDGIFIADHQGVALWMNDTSIKILGVPRNEVIGQHVDVLEKKGLFTPSVTKDVLEERRTISKVQKSLNRQYLAIGTIVSIPENLSEFVLVQIRDITDTVRASLELENAELLLKKYWDELQTIKRQEVKESNNLIIGKSKKHQELMTLVNQIAPYDTTILLQGETGVGKSLIANEIHHKSTRSQQPFLQINCGAIPENLLESELFGYRRGAFTGASSKGKVGLVEKADGGTLFLDEISELSISLQSKILQLVQEKTYIPIGNDVEKSVDIRIIAATNEDLFKLIEEKKFRQDLYYRLNVISIQIPSLKERREDILPLIYHYISVFTLKYGKNITFDDDLLDFLQNYHWPGNIRELENMIERLVVTAMDQVVTMSSLPDNVLQGLPNEQNDLDALNGESLPSYLNKIEKNLINKARIKYKTTREAAKHLGLSQSSYMRRLKKYKFM